MSVLLQATFYLYWVTGSIQRGQEEETFVDFADN